MNQPIRSKKQLGQHFLTDHNIAKKIAETLSLSGYQDVLEIGPGMGMLTQYLLKKPTSLHLIEKDDEAVDFLQKEFPKLKGKIHAQDFLKCDVVSIIKQKQFAITGNFPYNISSQIVFKLLEIRDFVPEFSGMFQREVAQRICEQPGSKTYGILSVLSQAFYTAEYLFTVSEKVFNPRPKVKSGVIKLSRKKEQQLRCDEKLFFKIVKLAFQQRRKTLRNSLKMLQISSNLKEDAIFGQRPEQLSVQDFVLLTQLIANDTL